MAKMTLRQERMKNIKKEIKKPMVKRSVLAKWRDQIVKDVMENNDIVSKLTEKEKDIYCRGIICGCREMVSTLSLQQIIKIIID